MSLIDHLKTWARAVKRDGVTLWFAARHPGVPWYSRALGAVVVAYALSPVDLIPDFIPVLGYLDDLILLPGLIYLTLRTLPAPVLADCREQARQWMAREGRKPSSKVGLVLVMAVWLGAALVLWHWLAGP